jgi:hypothetical protein
MTVLNSIIPGKVNNRGINDKSIPDYTISNPTYPLHLPVITMVTPVGDLADDKGTQWIATSDFTKKFGNVLDHTTPYYNPNAALIAALSQGQQASIGVRRVSANKEVARVAISAFVQLVELPDYERDLAGKFKRDADGKKIPTGETFTTALSIEIKPDPEAKKGVAVGALTRRTITGTPANGEVPAVPDTIVYPLFEAVAGVGDLYNRGGLVTGVSDNAVNWRAVSEFVTATGVFPFDLKMFTETETGARSFSKTPKRLETVSYTLFKTEINGVRFSIKDGFGQFTGTNVNRKVVPVQQPFNSVYVYEDHIASLCQAMYAVEEPNNPNMLDTSQFPYQQMNPFTCVNHTGAPYYALVSAGAVTWDMTGSVKAKGGVSPFLDADGKLPAYATQPELDDPFNVLANAKFPITNVQAWEINNKLMALDMTEYLAGTETKNYTKNRQSFYWDVGFSQEVKDLSVQLLASRKDIIVIPDATVFTPGKTNTLAEVYSRFTALSAQAKLFPESQYWGTPTCRSAVNLIEAYMIDEKSGEAMSGNLDLAYAFALFAGNSAGVIRAAFSPDSKDNRNLRIMHSPNIEFEEDFVAGDNFTNGGITLRPRNVETLFRPSLVTLYPNADSVLKDLVTNFLCVCIEKIAQDEWNNVCGDTSLSASDYVANFKDGAERKCRDNLGGLCKSITFVPSYDETQPGGRAVMNTIAHAYFNKGKYMMNLDLFAYNEEDLATNS